MLVLSADLAAVSVPFTIELLSATGDQPDLRNGKRRRWRSRCRQRLVARRTSGVIRHRGRLFAADSFMRTSGAKRKSKQLMLALVRRGSESSKAPRVARKAAAPPREPTICTSCGASFLRRAWRKRPLSTPLLDQATWGSCPACEQIGRCEYYGRVIATVADIPDRDAIDRRIRNVASRASHTRPERRIVSIDWTGPRLEVLTTSQKLAHRVALELAKAFGGRNSFRWSSEDGSLTAVWHPEMRRA
jgi:hypothetical protein